MKLDVIIFDMDGVLFHVHESYRNAIRRTVQMYLQECLGLPSYQGDLVSQEDMAAIKATSGFNEDWDTTTAILKYFLSLLPDASIPPDGADRPKGESVRIADVIKWLRQRGQSLNTPVQSLCERKDIPAYARTLRETGVGLDAVWKVLGDVNDALLYAHGDLRKTNLVQRIFQELYLGKDLFLRLYEEPPIFNHTDGLIHRERLIPDSAVLRRLTEQVQLGIATGRPRAEALLALERAGIRDLFRSIVTLDDVEEAEEAEYRRRGKRVSLGKPHPYPLLEAVRRITDRPARCAYIGDIPDDVRAANRAKAELPFVSIGCLAVAQDPQITRAEFEQAGADVILNHPDQLLDLLEEGLDHG